MSFPAGKIGARRFLLASFLTIFLLPAVAGAEGSVRFKKIPLQYIVALGDPEASSGDNAQSWGLWNQDPGPRGCRLENYGELEKSGVAPARWAYDPKDWWLEEHGLIMEKPVFPLAPGKYVVTGGRETTAVLTVDPANADGAQHWRLDRGAKLYDVTHLPCHAARYTPGEGEAPCSPERVDAAAFPVAPGAPMPPVKGCREKEYAVLFVIGVAEKAQT